MFRNPRLLNVFIEYPKVFFYILLCILFSTKIYSQTPVVEWHKTLGGKNGDYAQSIQPTSDGGYIVAGYTEGTDDGDITGYKGNVDLGDVWVAKLDAAGNIQWQKCFGGTYTEKEAFIYETPEGGYILASSTGSIDCDIKTHQHGLDYWLVKLNNKGDIQWQRNYGGTLHEYLYSLSIAKDDGYFMAGSAQSTDGDVTGVKGERDFWIVKVDLSGNIIWQKTLGGTGEDQAHSIDATADGGCIVSGMTYSFDGDVTGNHGGGDYWVVKLNSAGNVVWKKCYGGPSKEESWSVKAALDGGYIVTGQSTSSTGDVAGNYGGADLWLLKLNASGDIQWQQNYGGHKSEIGYSIETTADGGYIVAGEAESEDFDLTCNSGVTDLWVIKTNSTGTLQWQKSLGGNNYDKAMSVKVVPSGGYILAGATCSSDIAGQRPQTRWEGTCPDFWVVKLSSPVASPPMPVITISPKSGEACLDKPVTFTVNVKYGSVNLRYRWEKNGVVVGGDSITYTANTWNENDQIKCIVTTVGNCQPVQTYESNIIVLKAIRDSGIQPTINIVSSSTTLCECTPIIFNASVANSGLNPKFLWQINGISQSTSTNEFLSYNLKDGDEIKCIFSNNTTCVTKTPAASNVIKILGAGVQPATVTISATDTLLCEEKEIRFTAFAQNVGIHPTYQWKINGVNTGANNSQMVLQTPKNNDIISCVVTTGAASKCASPGTTTSNAVKVTVFEKQPPSASISASAINICQNYPVIFNAASIYMGANPSYQWYLNNVALADGDSTLKISTLSDGDKVQCLISSDPNFTCVRGITQASNVITVTVSSLPSPAIIIQSSASSVCQGVAVTFDASTENAGTSPSFSWTVNGKSVGERSSRFISSFLKNGDLVSCEVLPGADAYCPDNTVESNIISPIIYDSLRVSISPADTTILSGTQIQLKPIVHDVVSSYSWHPADKLTNPMAFEPHTKILSEDQNYILEAINSNGCKGSAVAIVKLSTLLIMPNAFTPNGDRINDVFRIPLNTHLNLTLFSIYNRWGQKIFSTANIREGWDGKINGSPAPPGIYMYLISGNDNKGSVGKKGTVVLIR